MSSQHLATLDRTALLLIDVQRGFFGDTQSHWGAGSPSNPSFESNLSSLLADFRAQRTTGRPMIIHVKHISRIPTSILNLDGSVYRQQSGEWHADYMPIEGEHRISKHENSAFIGTNLEALLREHKISTLFIAGLTTDHCVSTTTRMAANLGVTRYEGEGDGKVILVQDATRTWAKGEFDAATVHRVNVASLNEEFCEAWTTAEVRSRLRAGR